jgi:hypothetical protein
MSDKLEKEENAETVALTPAVTVTEKPKNLNENLLGH